MGRIRCYFCKHKKQCKGEFADVKKLQQKVVVLEQELSKTKQERDYYLILLDGVMSR